MFERPVDRENVKQVWNHWCDVARKPNAALKHPQAETIAGRLDQGATVDECRAALDAASRDQWYVKGGMLLTLILGDEERFQHLSTAKEEDQQPMPHPARSGTIGSDGGAGPSPEEVFGGK